MAIHSISPEHQSPDDTHYNSEITKRQRLGQFVRGKLLHLISGGDSAVAIVPHETVSETEVQLPAVPAMAPKLAVRVPKQKDASFNGSATPPIHEVATPARMLTVEESIGQNPKLAGETRTDYIKRMTDPQSPQLPDALTVPVNVPTSDPTPEGDAAYQDTYGPYVPKHRANVPPDAVISQPPVDAHIYNNMQAEARPHLHVVK